MSGPNIYICRMWFNRGWKMGHRNPTAHWESERCLPEAKLIINRNFFTKKSVLNIYIIPFFVYDSKCWKSPQRWRNDLRQNKFVSIEECLEYYELNTSESVRENRNKKKHRIRKWQLKLLRHIMRKVCFENLTRTRHW